MILAADYPFLDILWSMIIFFAWVIWIFMVFTILVDVFRRRDISGWAKAAWAVFLIVLPFIGALSYLIFQHDGMAERSAEQAKSQKRQADDYIRTVAGGAATEIEKAKQLLDSGAITQDEFATLKAKALGADAVTQV
jgi:Phospholipase_D-nuclease N-terminal/Short C-terminal domain